MSNDLKEKIITALKEFKEKDRIDLMNVNIYELTISHRIAVYLEKEFPEFNVDCEYNKNLGDPKRNQEDKNIRPDIIIHLRGTEKNLVIFEIKKCGKDNKKAKCDMRKLKEIILSGLNYKLGVFVGVLKKKIDVVWIEKINGKIVNTSEII